MKNLDITIVAPAGAGKSTLARKIFDVMGVTPERIVEVMADARVTCSSLVEDLKGTGADAVVFDLPLEADLPAVAEAVEFYRSVTRRNVTAVYCIQAKQTEFLTYR